MFVSLYIKSLTYWYGEFKLSWLAGQWLLRSLQLISIYSSSRFSVEDILVS